MAALFTDDVMHIGADETFVTPGAEERCSPNTTAFLERQVVAAVACVLHLHTGATLEVALCGSARAVH